jgi:hypothetical protein
MTLMTYVVGKGDLYLKEDNEKETIWTNSWEDAKKFNSREEAENQLLDECEVKVVDL